MKSVSVGWRASNCTIKRACEHGIMHCMILIDFDRGEGQS